jgi:transposase
MAIMLSRGDRAEIPTAIRTDLGAIFVSLELSRSTWLVTSLSPGNGEKMSKHSVPSGDVRNLIGRFRALQERARVRTKQMLPLVVIQEAGLEGFWIHRVLTARGIESHIVDPASVATSRRRRRAKTDKLDGDTLVRTLLAFKRGEPRVCAMVRVPTPEEEDRRRMSRERRVLLTERIQHSNRIKGLLFGQGISGYEPLRRDRRQMLIGLRTGDGRMLPHHLKAQISRELDRLELVVQQLKEIEDELQDAIVAADAATMVPRMLIGLKGIGDEFATLLWTECLYRRFDNRRQVAAYAGLAPTPWQSGSIDREQGVSKAGNPRLRAMLIQLAWLWLRHQPNSALTRWFLDRVKANGGRLKKPTIVALARKLLVALWKYVSSGVIIEGAITKAA